MPAHLPIYATHLIDGLIVGVADYPIYNPKAAAHAHCSAAAYESIEGELADPNAAFVSCEDTGEGAGCRTVGDITAEAAASMEGLFYAYGVDIWNAGHAHMYGVTWPMLNGSAPKLSYVDPGQATVYITEGNGGVPGVKASQTWSNVTVQWGRIHGEGGAYGRISVPGGLSAAAAALKYDHVWNNGNSGKGQVTDSFSITRTEPHVWPIPPLPPPGPPAPGPYPPGPPPPPPTPPAPPPAGQAWKCYSDRTLYCADVGLQYLGTVKSYPTSVNACERAVNAVEGISALLYHGGTYHGKESGYCHPCTGPAVSAGKFSAALKHKKSYTACVLQ